MQTRRLYILLLLWVVSFCACGDVIVFKNGKELEGRVLRDQETPEEVNLETASGVMTLKKTGTNPVVAIRYAGGETVSIAAPASVPSTAEAHRVAGRYEEALKLYLDACARDPNSAPGLASSFDKIWYELLDRAQKEEKALNLEKAREYYGILYRVFANASAKLLVTVPGVHDRVFQSIRDRLSFVCFQIAAQAQNQPNQWKQAQALLLEAVNVNPRDDYRFQYARFAQLNKDYVVAHENFQIVAQSPAAPEELKRKANDAIAQIKAVADLGQQPRAPTPTPATIAPTAAQPTPPAAATPPPPESPGSAVPSRPTGPKWKVVLYDIEQHAITRQIKGVGQRVLGGEYSALVVGIPLFIVIFWVIPYYFLRSQANKGDIVAAQYRMLAKRIGLVAVGLWAVKGVSFSRPKNRCPFCNKGIDNIDSYTDLNFLVCPHCREAITPIYDLRDYISHLIDQIESEAKRTKGTNLESAVEKDAMLKLVRGIITLAIRRRASDLHIDCESAGAKVRARIDGMMYELQELPHNVSIAFLQSIKVMTGSIDITEKRVPQDGKVNMWVDKNDIDLRVNTTPTALGEKMSIRILNQKTIQVDSTKLGIEGDNLEKFERSIRRPHGLIIVTGPTGSGKSTTLYVALNTINTGEKNIITIEDPVEYQLKGLTQQQVNLAANFTFATGLRSILRQDPDVIMVGEIRDKDTAEIAVDAAMTGHLVFTTLHTIDSATAFSRLADLGVESRRIASAVICVAAQNLVRTICPDCKKPYKPKKTDLEALGISTTAKDMTFAHGTGCDSCMNTGYCGRIGIFEFMTPDEAMKEILETNPPTSVIKELARKHGMRTLREEGIVKIMQGITTVEEVIRVTS